MRRCPKCGTLIQSDEECPMAHKKRVTSRRLASEFLRGLSFVGLARKHGLTSLQVQDRVRSVVRKRT